MASYSAKSTRKMKMSFRSLTRSLSFTVEEHYGSQGLIIVGYFHANVRFDDIELGIVAKNIGDHICRYFPQAAILFVCILINAGSVYIVIYAALLVILYTRDASKKWKLAGPDGGSRLVIKEPAANVTFHLRNGRIS
ncbi:hypothetical protein J1N35_044615 [Gossypium stocksii]|uniref:Uncharacterized protein n=1 Tax=Gossypium stocksii TaxID=47602 RepID=A0A9D3U9D1_9ROSI|nr:hypothetical protein J1N35_044615 [Gossypium stocksii]